MTAELVVKHKLINLVQSVSLFLVLAILIAYIAHAIAGEALAWFALAAVIILFVANPVVTPWFILRMYEAQPLRVLDAPTLYQVVNVIAERAQLQNAPQLFYIPSRVINAFAVGSSRDSAIAISHGVLDKLTFDELAGILAHEISHIKNNDIRVMTFADIAGRITKLLSLFGQFLIILNLPLILFTDMQLNWVPLLVMVFAPLISDLIQLGLSRIREYDADLGSAILLGDPKPLASALAKMEYYKHSYIGSIFTPILKIPEPSLLRTHPPTQERINRLLKFASETQLRPVSHPVSEFTDEQPVFIVQRQVRSPRRRLTGFWY